MVYRHLATKNASSVPLHLMKDLIQCRFVVELKFKHFKIHFMTKFFFSIALFTLFGVNTFAADSPVTKPVLHSFQKSFSSAKEVAWTVSKDIYKAEFTFTNQHVTAYYDGAGTLLGLSKNILSTQLPVLLQNSLKENYNDYWIASLIEFSTEEGTSYYATLENADNKMIIKSNVNSWSVDKKIKK
jgi:hypothetical protein